MKKETIRRRLEKKPVLIDVHTHVGMSPANYLRGDFPYAQTAESLLVRMDRWGVDCSVCFPCLYTDYFSMNSFLEGRMRKNRLRRSQVPYAIENRRLCEEIYEAYPRAAGRLLPFFFFDPSREPAGQVDVLRELFNEYPVFGLKTATSYLQSPITDLLGRGRCLLDVAAEQGLPVMLHTSVMPGDPWAAVTACLEVVEARPDVRFCLAHTCRFDRRALDRADALPNCFVDLSAFHIHCDLAQSNSPAVAATPHRFRAAYGQPPRALNAFAAAYPDTIMWGTDSPYYCFMSRFIDVDGNTTTMHLSCDTDSEIAAFRKLPDALRRQIGHTNTLKFLFG